MSGCLYAKTTNFNDYGYPSTAKPWIDQLLWPIFFIILLGIIVTIVVIVQSSKKKQQKIVNHQVGRTNNGFIEKSDREKPASYKIRRVIASLNGQVFTKPDITAAKIIEVHEGDKLIILDETDDFYHVKLDANNNVTGYIEKNLLAKRVTVALKGDIFVDPSITSEAVCEVFQGDILIILGETEKFYHVKLQSDQSISGYVGKELLFNSQEQERIISGPGESPMENNKQEKFAPANTKKRHGCLTTYLIFIIVINTIDVIYYASQNGSINHILWVPESTIFVYIIFCLFTIACATALLNLKKWGFWGFCIIEIIGLVVNVSLSVNVALSIWSLTSIAMLYLVLNIGDEDNKGWPQLD